MQHRARCQPFLLEGVELDADQSPQRFLTEHRSDIRDFSAESTIHRCDPGLCHPGRGSPGPGCVIADRRCGQSRAKDRSVCRRDAPPSVRTASSRKAASLLSEKLLQERDVEPRILRGHKLQRQHTGGGRSLVIGETVEEVFSQLAFVTGWPSMRARAVA